MSKEPLEYIQHIAAKYLKQCNFPVVLFHGDADDVIYYGSSLKLISECKNIDTLITLNGQGHHGINDNSQYIDATKKLLQ